MPGEKQQHGLWSFQRDGFVAFRGSRLFSKESCDSSEDKRCNLQAGCICLYIHIWVCLNAQAYTHNFPVHTLPLLIVFAFFRVDFEEPSVPS